MKLLVAAMTWAFATSRLSGVRPHKCVASKKAHKKLTTLCFEKGSQSRVIGSARGRKRDMLAFLHSTLAQHRLLLIYFYKLAEILILVVCRGFKQCGTCGESWRTTADAT